VRQPCGIMSLGQIATCHKKRQLRLPLFISDILVQPVLPASCLHCALRTCPCFSLRPNSLRKPLYVNRLRADSGKTLNIFI